MPLRLVLRLQIIVIIIILFFVNARVRLQQSPSLPTAQLVVHILDVLLHLVFASSEAATLAFLGGVLRSLATTYRAEEFKDLGCMRVGKMTFEVRLPPESKTGTLCIRALELAGGEDMASDAI